YLPIEGIEANLSGGGGDLRYPGIKGGLPVFDAKASATQTSVGAALYFNVAPGAYTLHATRPGDTLQDAALVVQAGAVTLAVITRGGDAGTSNVAITGTVSASPAVPAYGAAAPLGGVDITVFDENGGKGVSTMTDVSGGYSLGLPYTRHLADMTLKNDF